MKEVSESDFEELVLKNGKPVLVDFSASWCGPCRILSPILDELSKELEGKTDIFKVDIDKCTDLAVKYGINSIPCMILFAEGEAIKRHVGIMNKEELLEYFGNIEE